MELDLIINEKKFPVEKKEGKTIINGKEVTYKAKYLSEDKIVLSLGNKSFEIEKLNIDKKNYKLKVGQKIVEVSIKDSLDKILERLGMDAMVEEAVNEVLAPMPGAIINVMVKEGDEVQKGDPLIILEAMKMENIIKSPTDATVTAVNVKVGQNVDKNHPLVIF
jgi:acetyl/propionyl-CoA carboxylase alpha subunit